MVGKGFNVSSDCELSATFFVRVRLNYDIIKSKPLHNEHI
jgi:hypothetical protein